MVSQAPWRRRSGERYVETSGEDKTDAEVAGRGLYRLTNGVPIASRRTTRDRQIPLVGAAEAELA